VKQPERTLNKRNKKPLSKPTQISAAGTPMEPHVCLTKLDILSCEKLGIMINKTKEKTNAEENAPQTDK
jgi:hypothetical protein